MPLTGGPLGWGPSAITTGTLAVSMTPPHATKPTNHHRVGGTVALGKRKERELLPQAPAKALAKPGTNEPAQAQAPVPNNKLLVGYLAHEFLTRGMLQGCRVEPTKPSQAASSDLREPVPEPSAAKRRRYADVSWLLMVSRVHVPGVVNPTQLVRWLQIKE
ncbi:hypothetical protein E2562_002201 [Oryza meyeriana var. granulata]|uniref:Uncharacterized protein n=1 Tax=Oryza meyeriana var. granulata TaxID=110450 RepID=A0A6G1EE86_9ORYZ|nr:hypothetical protein E2562_002201 [Oryza meyeriana var. granulata]